VYIFPIAAERAAMGKILSSLRCGNDKSQQFFGCEVAIGTFYYPKG